MYINFSKIIYIQLILSIIFYIYEENNYESNKKNKYYNFYIYDINSNNSKINHYFNLSYYYKIFFIIFIFNFFNILHIFLLLLLNAHYNPLKRRVYRLFLLQNIKNLYPCNFSQHLLFLLLESI